MISDGKIAGPGRALGKTFSGKAREIGMRHLRIS
jgi:hypothetical protein